MQGRGVPASEEGGPFVLNICFYKLAKERVGLLHVEKTGVSCEAEGGIREESIKRKLSEELDRKVGN